MLSPLHTLFDVAGGEEIALPPRLKALYAHLAFPIPDTRPWVIGNFVSTLDGVTVLGDPELEGGGVISGYNAHDRMVMGLLRSVADVVMVGAGTLRAEPRLLLTPRQIYPDLADEYATIRETLGLLANPVQVFVTASGELDIRLRVFQSSIPVLIVTTVSGEQRLRQQVVPPSVMIEAASDGARLTATAILDAVQRIHPSRIILNEGGPKLMSDFFAEGKLDELFLTIAPQVAGRDKTVERPGFVDGKLFIPASPVWGRLVSVKRADHHLLLRYAFT